MRMYDLIEEKKRGGALSDREIAYMIQGFTGGEIPDYQMAAMLITMAPIVVLYFAFSKQIIKGMVAGAVKG